MEIKISKTTFAKAEAVAAMYDEWRAFLRASGVDQWTDNYPVLENVFEDIESCASYLLTADGEPAAGMAIVEREPDYDKIYGGAWLTGESGEYLAVHRVCVREKFRRRGLTEKLYAFAESLVRSCGRKSLRADTHRDNLAMRAALKKNGFIECGVIYPAYGGERIAYEKVVKE